MIITDAEKPIADSSLRQRSGDFISRSALALDNNSLEFACLEELADRCVCGAGTAFFGPVDIDFGDIGFEA